MEVSWLTLQRNNWKTANGHFEPIYSAYTYKPFTYFFLQVHGSMRFLEKQNIRFRRISLSQPFQFWGKSGKCPLSSKQALLGQLFNKYSTWRPGVKARVEDLSTETELQPFGRIPPGDFSFHQLSVESTAIPGGLVRGGSLRPMNGSTLRSAKSLI